MVCSKLGCSREKCVCAMFLIQNEDSTWQKVPCWKGENFRDSVCTAKTHLLSLDTGSSFLFLFLLVEFTVFGMNMVNLLLRRDTRISSSCF
jgi:hypothetical protein